MFGIMIIISILSVIFKANELINISWFAAYTPMIFTFTISLVYHIKEVLKKN